MKRCISLFIMVLILCGCFVPSVLAEQTMLTEEMKDQIHTWLSERMSFEVPKESLICEDMLGENGSKDYAIYHARSSLLGSLSVIQFDRVGNYVFTAGSTDKCLTVCQIENGVCIGIYSLRDAYDVGIVDDTVFEQMIDPCDNIWISRVGDVNLDSVIDVADIMEMKNKILTDSYPFVSDQTEELYYDVDKNNVIDVGDIMALKSIIMAL